MDFLLLHSTTILLGFIRLEEGKATFDDFVQVDPHTTGKDGTDHTKYQKPWLEYTIQFFLFSVPALEQS